MTERRFLISVVGGPLDGLEELIGELPPDVLVSGDCVCELYDIETCEPRRWVYHCACSSEGGPSVPDAGPQAR